MKTLEEINQSIAYIKDGDVYFQILNEAGNDWDEAATREVYDAWLLTQR
jgi:hypothetical protein